MSDPFKGKTAIVTGAASGLGKTLATDLAGLGTRLVLADRDAASLASVVDALAKKSSAVLGSPTDVTDEGQCRRLIARTVEAFQHIDYLILCAGISMWAPFDKITDLSLFRRIMEINFLGVVHCVHPALPHLRKSHGTLVTISSTQGVIGLPNHTGYSASKHAVNGFLEALEMEVGEEVGILNVLPGWIRGTNLRRNALTADGRSAGTTRQHSRDSVSVEETSAAILDALRRRKRELYLPPKLRFVPWVRLVAPRWLKARIKKAVHEQSREQV